VSKAATPKSLLNRRSFLGGSLSATVASLALPAALPSLAAEALPPTAAPAASAGAAPADPEIAFRAAKPIWPQGLEKEMNISVGFRAVFEAPPGHHVRLRLTGSTLYRIFLNGQFFSCGPARTARGHFRVDVFDLTSQLVPGKNLIAIEVAGYNVNSYYVLDQPSFLIAEVTTDAAVLASTGGVGAPFKARVITERVQKVQRYSFQRSFSEIYHLDAQSTAWRERIDASIPPVACATFPVQKLIPRRVPHPSFFQRQPEQIAAEGTFRWGANGPKSLAEDHSVPYGAKISPTLHGFPEQQIPEIPYLELQKTESVVNNRIDQQYVWDQSLHIDVNEFKTLDFGTDIVGFFGARVTVTTPTKLYFTFDETLTKGDIDFTRLMCVNIVAYTLAPGTYNLECFEPYTMRFLKLMVLEGACDVSQIYLREYTAPDVWSGHFHTNDEGLNQLFTAGIETYRPNAIELFTDTPSRERAGWLCDSSFTAQVSPLLSGHTKVEKCYLENFLLPDHFPNIPAGMVPSCYPADQYDGGFCPTWGLWFLIQLEQYQLRSGDHEMVEAFRPRVLKLLDYFQAFQNSDGLLEKLTGWVFIEWSKSNDYVQDVSYAANMLYAAALAAVGRVYSLQQRVEQAEALRAVIRAQSYNGEFFVDNAVRQGGKLVPTSNRTETCQYYAFYFDTASVDKYPKLWETLHTQFGPPRLSTKAFADIAPSNAFMGNIMRLELLSRAGLTDQLVAEAKSYFLYMAELTGTFWENMSNEASMNHAFGSHIIVHLYRDVLGIHRLDMVNKTVHLRFTQSSLEVCEGRIPTPDGFVTMRWTRTPDTLTYQLDVPAGYKVSVENLGSFTVVQKRFPHGKVNYGYKVDGGYK
jgi:alpha-L-rhamnosidase